MKVKELKRGDYFKRKENAARVLVRGEYVREIAADFVRVGCHKIPAENLAALVSALVLPSAPVETSIL